MGFQEFIDEYRKRRQIKKMFKRQDKYLDAKYLAGNETLNPLYRKYNIDPMGHKRKKPKSKEES